MTGSLVWGHLTMCSLFNQFSTRELRSDHRQAAQGFGPSKVRKYNDMSIHTGVNRGSVLRLDTTFLSR